MFRNIYNFFLGLDAPVNERNQTKLMRAVIENNLSTVQSLITQKANLDAQDYIGETALSWAIRFGYDDMAKYLIQKGAKVNTHGDFGDTPLIIASGRYKLELVQQLLEAKADVNEKNLSMSTALDGIIQYIPKINSLIDILKILLENGAELNRPDTLFSLLQLFNDKKPNHPSIFPILHEFYIRQSIMRENKVTGIQRLSDADYALLETLYTKHPGYKKGLEETYKIADHETGFKFPEVLLKLIAEYFGPNVPTNKR